MVSEICRVVIPLAYPLVKKRFWCYSIHGSVNGDPVRLLFCGDLTILLLGLIIYCLFKLKRKLRHSFGRPSRSDLVQLEFVEEEKIMIKNIAIVSLSSGTIGEDFVKHEVDIGIKRLNDFGLNVRFMPHALEGIEYVKNHPEKRAADLLQALSDPEIDMILCAIGGDDTYRLLPFLFEHNELADAVSDKVFLGFSDTTINHFMLHKVGMKTFYGQSFLADVCELDKDMLPYTKKYFEELNKYRNDKRSQTQRNLVRRKDGFWYQSGWHTFKISFRLWF